MDSQWFKEHELDMDRTRYTHNADIANTFRIANSLSLRAGYGFEYKNQYRPFQLHAVYTEDSKVYTDDWFAPRQGKATTKYDTGDSTIEIDKERWSAYRALDGEDNIASKFEERLFKHTWNAGITLRKGPTTVNVDAKFALRLDDSKFHNDELVKDFDFSDETWGKLGYYYGGTDYFEHKYPIVATTAFEPFQNRFTLTPRFKTYNGSHGSSRARNRRCRERCSRSSRSLPPGGACGPWSQTGPSTGRPRYSPRIGILCRI